MSIFHGVNHCTVCLKCRYVIRYMAKSIESITHISSSSSYGSCMKKSDKCNFFQYTRLKIITYCVSVVRVCVPRKRISKKTFKFNSIVTNTFTIGLTIFYYQYIKDYKVGICRGGRQSTVRGSTVNSEVIDDQQSTVNSEAIDNQWSTVRQLMINTVDC